MGSGRPCLEPQLQDLDDEMVKLVAYNIVCLEYGKEQIVQGGQGTMIIVERMDREQFVAYAIAQWLESVEKLPAHDRKKALDFDRSTLDVYFIVSRRWPRRDPKFDERRTEALDSVRYKLETGRGKGRVKR